MTAVFQHCVVYDYVYEMMLHTQSSNGGENITSSCSKMAKKLLPINMLSDFGHSLRTKFFLKRKTLEKILIIISEVGYYIHVRVMHSLELKAHLQRF